MNNERKQGEGAWLPKLTRRRFVKTAGAVTALGFGVDRTFDALLAGPANGGKIKVADLFPRGKPADTQEAPA